MRSLLLLLFLIPGLLSAQEAGKPHTPAAGTAERTAILDALRDPLEDGFGQAIIFRVRHLKMHHGWAYLEVEPRTKADKPLSYKDTVWAEEAEYMDNGVLALLRFKRKRWYVVKMFVGPTDYPLEYFYRYKAPRTIFPKIGG